MNKEMKDLLLKVILFGMGLFIFFGYTKIQKEVTRAILFPKGDLKQELS